MKFHGLFIGVDRYASPSIGWLSCAKRDATALHALFSDTLGGDTVLLTDSDATREAIAQQFQRLASCSPDDIVVITYSGHGSESQELVTYDANVSDLATTAIPLDLLTEWFSAIPAKRLICILDCCFSGGMGAKVLHVDTKSRSLASTDNLLNQLSGEGRLIFTASSATEEAWESSRARHGLLTYYLLEALQGAEEVRSAGRISVYRLLEYVSQRVIDTSSQIGQVQHPTLRGTIDGNLTWPVFAPGALYSSHFPERVRPLVTEDVSSLQGYGFPDGLLRSWASAIPRLNQLQIDAINEYGILDGEHLLVSAPTSSGKTLIGELAALKGTLERRRTLFLFPLKALVNDKYRHFTQLYGNFGIRTIRATGDSTSDEILPFMRGQYDICLLTYEKFAALALANPFILRQVASVVVDEVQMIADKSRGVNLEFVLTLLKMHRQRGIEPQIIALSAVIGDTNGLERWLGGRLLKRTERPVPLDEGIITGAGTFRYISSDTGEEHVIRSYIRPEFGKGSSQDLVKPLVRRLVQEGKHVIVFRETRGEARGCAKYLSESSGLPPARTALSILPDGDPSLATNVLRETLQGGVAFHISDLDVDERLLIEEQFRTPSSDLRVIAATTTLAMGVNTPAEAVITAGLTHPGDEPYSVAEYKNIAGRAGRLGFAERGLSFLVAMTPSEEHYYWNTYIKGEPEDLRSRFVSTDVRSLILRVLVAVQRATTKTKGLSAANIIEFLEASFGAFQEKSTYSHWEWDSAGVIRGLESLRSHRLVEKDDDVYHLTDLGRFAGEAGVEVESVVRLVDALGGSNASSITDPTLIAATQLTVELDEISFPLNKKSTQKEPHFWQGELRGQGISYSVLASLQASVTDSHQGTLRAKKAVACLLFITETPISEIESALTQFGGRFNGAAGPIRSVRSRTCDLLPVTAKVAQFLYPELDLQKRLPRLVARLEIGVPSEIVEVAMLVGTALSRGDYLKLLGSRLNTKDSLVAADDEVLLSVLGGDQRKVDLVRAALTKEEEGVDLSQYRPVLPKYKA